MKIFDTPKKARKRHTAAYYVIGVFTFAIEAMLGLNAAFLIDQSVSIVAHNMLAGTPVDSFAAVITLSISLVVGACFIAGGFWTYGGFMDSLDDAHAYASAYGARWWPVGLVWGGAVAVVALDLTTLFFRAAFFAERGAIALFVFFVILVFLPFLLGCLMHVLEHTPHDRRLAKTRQFVEAIEIDDLDKAAREMDPDLRSRWLSGDANALQEHYDRVERRRQYAYDSKQQQIEEQQRGNAEKNRPLLTASLANEADQRSQRGH